MREKIGKPARIGTIIISMALLGLVGYAGHLLLNIVKSAEKTAAMAAILEREATIHSFQDAYKELPGDMAAPQSIEGCIEVKCTGGNGDGKIGQEIRMGANLRTGEGALFWQHLEAAALTVPGYNGLMPIGGHLHAAYYQGRESLPLTVQNDGGVPGNYFVWIKGDVIGRDAIFLPAAAALMIDRLLDDGLPSSGRFIAGGSEECFIMNAVGVLDYNLQHKRPCAIGYYRLEDSISFSSTKDNF